MSYFMRPEHQYRSRPQAGPRPEFVSPSRVLPRQMEARFAGTCKACGTRIEAGEQILYSRELGAKHLECPKAQAIAPLAVAQQTEVEAPRTLDLDDAGVYRLPDGAICQVKANREKTRVYAKRLVEHKGIDRLTEEGAHVHAEYVYEAGLIAQVSREGVKLTLEEAKALTLRYGFCIRCGRHLTDGRSVEQGMGPVCITYFEGA